MPQNIYDDLPFFEGYRALRLQDSGLNGVIEEPALRALLPPLKGLRIVDLGCEATARRPLLENERRRPPFLLIAAAKPRCAV